MAGKAGAEGQKRTILTKYLSCLICDWAEILKIDTPKIIGQALGLLLLNKCKAVFTSNTYTDWPLTVSMLCLMLC